jgi:hypothetical protein
MKSELHIFLEGIADKKFFVDIIVRWYNFVQDEKNIVENKDIILFRNDKNDKVTITSYGGKDVLEDDKKRKALIDNLDSNLLLNIPSLLIFDSDKDYIGNLNKWIKFRTSLNNSKYDSLFNFFFLPINFDLSKEFNGDLEYLIYELLFDEKDNFTNCWKTFENCIENYNLNKYPIVFPDLKTKIFALLDIYNKKSKEKDRDYLDTTIFNLNPEEKPILQPLKAFLDQYLLIYA